jgi:hypothetical protein
MNSTATSKGGNTKKKHKEEEIVVMAYQNPEVKDPNQDSS